MKPNITENSTKKFIRIPESEIFKMETVEERLGEHNLLAKSCERSNDEHVVEITENSHTNSLLANVPKFRLRCQSPINEEVILKHIKEETLVVLEPTEQRQEDIFGNMIQDNSNIANNINITYHFDCNSQFMWQKFEIPWNQLPRQMIESCERGEREKHVINFIVHTVVNKMREIKSVIPSSAIKLVTKKIVDKFPETFRDLDEDGVVIGDGNHSVFRKIQDRNNYLNRPHKRTPKSSPHPKNKKKVMSQRAGCTNWDPPVDESAGSYMRQITENDENLTEKLEKCFPEQRRFLNTDSSFEAIERECPILLTEAGASFHFNKLTSSDMANLEPAVEEKFEKFLKLNGFEEVKHNDSKLLTVLEIVTRYFKEDLNLIYTEADDLPIPWTLESHPQIIRTDVQLEIFKKLSFISSKLGVLQETANLILRNRNSGMEPVIDGILFKTSKLVMNLPIKDESELEMMDTWLKESVENPVTLSNELSILGGTSSKDVTRKILYKTLSNEIGSLFSWDGAKGKRQFKKQTLASVIMRAVRLNAVAELATDSEIIGVIKHWLVHCKERLERGTKSEAETPRKKNQ